MFKIKCHDWSKSDFSADFKSVTTADELVSKWTNKQGSSLQTLGLNECVKIIVLGYFSIDEERKMEHFCFGPDEDRSNYICGDFNHIFQYLINHFSHPVSTILDLTEMQGIYIFSPSLFLTHSFFPMIFPLILP